MSASIFHLDTPVAACIQQADGDWFNAPLVTLLHSPDSSVPVPTVVLAVPGNSVVADEAPMMCAIDGHIDASRLAPTEWGDLDFCDIDEPAVTLAVAHFDHTFVAPVVQDRRAFDDVIAEEPELRDLIDEASKALARHFRGRATQEVVVEGRDEGEGPGQVHILVCTEMARGEARRLMDDFDDAWWIENLGRANGRLSVGLRLI